jgi:putative membrane protein
MAPDGNADRRMRAGAPTTLDRVVLPAIAIISVAVVAAVGFLQLGRTPAAATSSVLPGVNATLNGLSAVLLALGFALVRAGKVRAHRACMLGAFGVSALFLVSYVVYHSSFGSRPFAGQGWIRWVYFPLLISHIVLAAAIVPLALVTIYRALRGEVARHRRLARWTLPVWLYVSVTGVMVYWLLYRAAL